MSETAAHPAYAALLARLREADLYESISGLLSWDQETGMPPAAGALRSEQMAQMSGLAHDMRTDPRVGEWLAACEADAELTADPVVRANLREIRRDHDRAVKLPGSLVRQIAETTSLAQQAWRGARERDEYAAFAPWLEKVVSLARAKAECLREEGESLYDALMEEYEPGAREDEVERVFDDLRARLAPLIAAVREEGSAPRGRVQNGPVPLERQVELNRFVVSRIGFSFDAGRLDVSTHPFCQGIGPGDTRLTTRYDEGNFADALSSTLHEAGHGLYEQGLPKADHPGQPLGQSVSLGIHESQSRLWENQVGRSRAFWSWALPEAARILGAPLDGISLDEVYAAQNRVEPGLIRVESDEATYNLHIMLRFDLERGLLTGDLSTGDLPGAWNERMRGDLGVEVPDDRRGCLQDIHWSMGAIGYFPTYTLGNLYAAQLWEAALRRIPDLEVSIAAGEFASLRDWLRSEIHRHGRRFGAAELCERVTGRPLEPQPLLGYLEAKLRPLYGL